jgi:hypothetical protein
MICDGANSIDAVGAPSGADRLRSGLPSPPVPTCRIASWTIRSGQNLARGFPTDARTVLAAPGGASGDGHEGGAGAGDDDAGAPRPLRAVVRWRAGRNVLRQQTHLATTAGRDVHRADGAARPLSSRANAVVSPNLHQPSRLRGTRDVRDEWTRWTPMLRPARATSKQAEHLIDRRAKAQLTDRALRFDGAKATDRSISLRAFGGTGGPRGACTTAS